MSNEFMARAIQLAETPILSPHPNPRVGCVIVNDGNIVGEGFHEYAGAPHAEVNALAQAKDLAINATVYVSLEPCCFHGRTPPCANALINAGVKKVVVAMLDPNPKVAGKGILMLQQSGIDVETGVLTEQAEAINKGFIQRMRLGRPWVRCKMAMSFDGRTAMKNGESQWITGAEARDDVQRYRAKSDAILTGIGTVIADDPSMTIRKWPSNRQPLRVIVDTQLKSVPSQKIFHAQGNALVATLPQSLQKKAAFPDNTQLKVFPASTTGVDLSALLRFLAEQEINEVQVESGATLAGALLEAELIDEIVVYMSMSVMGDSARGLFSLPGLQAMKDKIHLKTQEIRQVGEDVRFVMKPEYQELVRE